MSAAPDTFPFLAGIDWAAPDTVREDGRRIWNTRCRVPFQFDCPSGSVARAERVIIDDGDGVKLDPAATGDPLGVDTVVFVSGIASSTSVDFFGTEMAPVALRLMAEQMSRGNGIAYLPRHNRGLSGGIEWDEIIGRTVHGEVVPVTTVASAHTDAEPQFVLIAHMQLFDEELAHKLLARVDRGETIGQSIGGWFTQLQIVMNEDDEIERVIILGVDLDHLAVTRAPANPDSSGIARLRSTIELEARSVTAQHQTDVVAKGLGEGKTARVFTSRVAGLRDAIKRQVAAGALEPGCLAIDTDGDRATLRYGERHIISAASTANTVIYQYLKGDAEVADVTEEELVGPPIVAGDRSKEYEEGDDDAPIGSTADETGNDGRPEGETLDDAGSIEPMCSLSVTDEDGRTSVSWNNDEDPANILTAAQAILGGEHGASAQRALDLAVVGASRDAVPFRSFPLADEGMAWSFTVTEENAVLGDPQDFGTFRSVHAWEDPDLDRETKARYKLPHHKRVGDEIRTVFRGVQAAMAALNGARGGTDIPEADRPRVHSHLRKHYEEFDREAPELRPLSAIATEVAFAVEQDRAYDLDAWLDALEAGDSAASDRTTWLADFLDKYTPAAHDTRDADARRSALPDTDSPAANQSSMSEGPAMSEALTLDAIRALLTDSLAPLNERMTALEGEKPGSAAPEPKPESEVDERVAALEASLAASEKRSASYEKVAADLLTRPQRFGRVGQLSIQPGPAAAGSYADLVERARDEAPGMAAVVERMIPAMIETDGAAKVTRRTLEANLAACLRAAENDGLITNPNFRAAWH